ncbi:MAG: flagellar brake protein [Synergistaceae bacterium]|nr:flagellar brake protein [Synergistaceae bacterium]
MARNSKDAPVLDYTFKLKPGVNGEIIINAGIYKGRYLSRVEDMRGEMVGFAHPLMKGVLLPVYRDMDFTFTMEDGSALFMFEMVVRRSETQSGLPIMWANNQGYPKRVQRRQFLRVPCLWPIFVYHLDYESRNPMLADWMPANAIDISLGGNRFRVLDEDAPDIVFESGDRVLMRFILAEREYLHPGTASRIVHSDRCWEVGVVFDSLSSTMEKKLFEYIRQQEMIWREES